MARSRRCMRRCRPLARAPGSESLVAWQSSSPRCQIAPRSWCSSSIKMHGSSWLNCHVGGCLIVVGACAGGCQPQGLSGCHQMHPHPVSAWPHTAPAHTGGVAAPHHPHQGTAPRGIAPRLSILSTSNVPKTICSLKLQCYTICPRGIDPIARLCNAAGEWGTERCQQARRGVRCGRPQGNFLAPDSAVTRKERDF